MRSRSYITARVERSTLCYKDQGARGQPAAGESDSTKVSPVQRSRTWRRSPGTTDTDRCGSSGQAWSPSRSSMPDDWDIASVCSRALAPLVSIAGMRPSMRRRQPFLPRSRGPRLSEIGSVGRRPRRLGIAFWRADKLAAEKQTPVAHDVHESPAVSRAAMNSRRLIHTCTLGMYTCTGPLTRTSSAAYQTSGSLGATADRRADSRSHSAVTRVTASSPRCNDESSTLLSECRRDLAADP